MKTTVHIPDTLLAEAQAVAAQENTTLKALIAEGLRHVVTERRRRKKRFVLEDLSFGNPGDPWPLEGKSWDEIRALIYEDRGG